MDLDCRWASQQMKGAQKGAESIALPVGIQVRLVPPGLKNEEAVPIGNFPAQVVVQATVSQGCILKDQGDRLDKLLFLFRQYLHLIIDKYHCPPLALMIHQRSEWLCGL